MYSNIQQSLSMSVPNLPGVLPARDSWIHRQYDGFKRSARPKSATSYSNKSRENMIMNLSASASSLLSQNQSNNNEELPEKKVRPISAGIERSKSSTLPYVHYDQQQTVDLFTVQRFVRPNTKETNDRYTARNKSSKSILTNFGITKEELPQRKQKNFSRTTSKLGLRDDITKIVCRFYGHFNEDRVWATDMPLGVPNIEDKITRKLTILYYIEDDTISMSEHVPMNSGMKGGSFYKRSKLEKDDDGSAVSLEDLVPGKSIHVLGREIYLSKCDEFTRAFLSEEYNIHVSKYADGYEPEPFREDMGALYATGLSSYLPDQRISHGTKSNHYYEVQEANDKISRYFKYDGKVLRFLCIETKDILYESSNDSYGGDGINGVTILEKTKKYCLSYYLVDRSIDIRVVKSIAGQAGQPKTLEDSFLVMKRSKIAHNWRDVQASSMVIPQYYEPEHLYCGRVVDVYGRTFLLVDSDKYTKDSYSSIGVDLKSIPVLIYEEKPVEQPIPKRGDGFIAIGSEEDTLATVYGMPKVSRDAFKQNKNQHRIIRSKLKICTSQSIDASRELMLTFYLEDDSIHIFEDSGRNSGIQSGTFLKRGKYNNALPNDANEPRYFKATDIYLGNVISVNGIDMKIVEMDNLSLKFCEAYPDEFPFFDPFRIAASLADFVSGYKINMRHIFTSLISKSSKNQTTRRDTVTKDVIIRVLTETRLIDEINEQETLTLLRRIQSEKNVPSAPNSPTSSPRKGITTMEYHYHELCDLFSHVLCKNVFKLKEDGLFVGDSIFDEVQAIDNLAGLLKFGRAKHTQWRRLFRRDYRSVESLLSLDLIYHLFKKKGLHLSDRCVDDIRNKYSVSNEQAQTYYKTVAAMINTKQQEFTTLNQSLRRDGSKLLNSSRYHESNTGLNTFSVGFEQSSSDVSVLPLVVPRNPTIAEKREMLLSSNRVGTNSMQSSQMDHGHMDSPVIDYAKLCNDIYICDWA